MLTTLRKYLRDRGISLWQLMFEALWHVLFEHEIMTRACAIAYSAMFAFVPFLILVTTIAAHMLPSLADPSGQSLGIANISAQQFIAFLHELFPPEAVAVIQDQIVRMQEQPPFAVLSITVLLSIYGSSRLFASVIDAINHIYGVAEQRPYWLVQLLTVFMTMVQTVILFSCVIAIVAWPQILSVIGLTGSTAWYATILNWFIVFIMILVSFAVTFHLGPSASRESKWVSPGAVFGTLMFLLATYGFRVYVQHFAHYQSFYGSLGGFMMLLFWLYVMSLVLLMAAEINKLALLAVRKKAAEAEAVRQAGQQAEAERNVAPTTRDDPASDKAGTPEPPHCQCCCCRKQRQEQTPQEAALENIEQQQPEQQSGDSQDRQ